MAETRHVWYSQGRWGRRLTSRVTKMQLGDHDQLSAQMRDYDTCFAEFLQPSGNGQKILQAILLREAFTLFALQGVAVVYVSPVFLQIPPGYSVQ
jgi:hypothetical protein